MEKSVPDFDSMTKIRRVTFFRHTLAVRSSALQLGMLSEHGLKTFTCANQALDSRAWLDSTPCVLIKA